MTKRTFGCLIPLCLIVAAVIAPCDAQLNLVPMWSPDTPTTTKPLGAFFLTHVAFGDNYVGYDTKADYGATIAGRYLFLERFTVALGGGLTRRDVGPTQGQRTVAHLFSSAAANVLHFEFGEESNEVAVSLVGGYGFSSLPSPSKEHGLTSGLDIHFVFWILEPWISPRIHWRNTTQPNLSQWQHGPAVTVGTSLGLNFAALVLAGEYVKLGESSLGLPRASTYAISLGLQLGW